MPYDEIKRNLRGLSYEELSELVVLANTLLAAKPLREVPIELDLAYRAFVSSLQDKMGLVPSMMVLKKQTLVEVRNALTFLLDWLKNACGGSISKTEIQPFFYLFGELLVEFLEERKVPLSLLAMIRQVKTVPSLVDKAFPSYIRAGVLRQVVLAMKRK